MVDFTKNKSWAATQVIEDDADSGNIGKTSPPFFMGDVDTILLNGFTRVNVAATNTPVGESGVLVTNISSATNGSQTFTIFSSDRTWFRRLSTTWQPWQEILHKGNIGNTDFVSGSAVGGEDRIAISPAGASRIDLAKSGTSVASLLLFLNDNGIVGSISTTGTTTAYNVSSDPRLKDFKGQPTDDVINAEFDKLFGCFDTFNWKNDPAGQLVWGFNAHYCIDAGLDIGTEGQGSRNLSLGDVYNTIPAVIEPQEVQVLYKTGDKKGEPRLNADLSPMMETVDVEITPEIDERVTPAGVDQAKAVPILLAKIEQLERRLVAAGI